MIVRGVEQKDVGSILALIKAKAEFDGCLDFLKSKEEEILNAFFSDTPKTHAIVVEEDNKVIGIATYYSIYSTFIAKPGVWLDDLFVYEQYRNSGAGKSLIVELCKIALEAGCGRIDWIVSRSNERGLNFYDSLGAQVFEEIRHARLDEEAILRLVRTT